MAQIDRATNPHMSVLCMAYPLDGVLGFDVCIPLVIKLQDAFFIWECDFRHLMLLERATLFGFRISMR